MPRIFSLPKTLTGQISLLIGATLILANLLNITATFYLMAPSARDPNAASFPAATAAHLAMNARTPAEVDAVVAAATRAGMHLFRVPATAMETGVTTVPPETLTQGTIALLLDVSGLKEEQEKLRLRGHNLFVLPLPDGSGLSFPIPQGARVSNYIIAPVIYVLVALAIVLLGVSLYAAKSLIAPLSSIAAAANSFGRSGGDEAIKEKGPAEIQQVAHALNDMRARISALLEERLSMLTAISHDLRTPLTRIRLRSEQILQQDANAKAARGILTDVSRMEHLLTETLIYMRDHRQGEAIVPVDLPSIIETICAELVDLGKKVSYNGPQRLVLHCQPSALTRALSNLVDNGLKYGDRVRIDLKTRPDGAIQIDVSDNGGGIPMLLRERIFEPFFKVDAARTAKQKEGFGLGLAIARNIVTAHGGNIQALAGAAGGTMVRISLPAAGPDTIAVHPARPHIQAQPL